jgi:hypothetical protein
MVKEMIPPARKEIRNLLIVLTGSVLCALLFGGLILKYYSPGGSYNAKNVLLSPEMTAVLSYADTNPKTGVKGRFIFDSLNFSYYDDVAKKWWHVPVNQLNYETFYKLVSSDSSPSGTHENIKKLFNQNHFSILNLKVRSDPRGSAEISTKTFQDIQFASQGDYYRVELREEGGQDTWAYFYHPGIYQESLQLFKGSP